MFVTSRYRLVSKATWSIAINLAGEWDPTSSPPEKAARLADGVWFLCDDNTLTSEETCYLKRGLEMVSGKIAEHKPVPDPILVKIAHVDYNPTDYQPEGLVVAAAQWASEAFHFPMPDIRAEYDKSRRRYVFSFESCTNDDSDSVIHATPSSPGSM